jgi:hypothetical protein
MPESGELQVVTTSLRNAARVWDQQAAALEAASARVSVMNMNRMEAGIFQIIVAPYDAVVAQVSARCEEGSRSMHGIASALELSAYGYSQAEQDNAVSIHRVHAMQGI